MSMKKRILSALLALCLTGSLAGTALAAGWQATPETARAAAAAPRQKEDTPAADAQPAAATAETAAPATPETAALPARTVEVTDAASGITVTVDVPEGALPADAELQVTLLGGGAATPETAQTPDDVAGELDGAGIEYDDFVSLDLTFYDTAGQEVEPLRPVQVRFTLPAALLPDDVDPATLAVQHLAEDENGEVETVETVADAAATADGTVTLDGDVTAAFETDGFSVYALTFSAKAAPRADGDGSTFTVTFFWDWLGDVGESSDETVTIDFKIVDTDGNPINVEEDIGFDYTYSSGALMAGHTLATFYEGTILDFLNGAEITNNVTAVDKGTLTENKDARPGQREEENGTVYNEITVGSDTYRFDKAVYTDELGRHLVDRMWLGSNVGGFFGLRLYDATLGQFDGTMGTDDEDPGDGLDPAAPIDLKTNSYYDIEQGTADYTIELIYQKQPVPTLEATYEKPEISKQAILRDDGTYDLSLQVVGEEIVPPASTKLDVLFVLDGSKSMKTNYFDDGVTSYQAALEQAATDLVNKLDDLEWNDPKTGQKIEMDIRYAAVQYGCTDIAGEGKFDDAWQLQNWTSDVSAIKTAINKSGENERDGGTNTQAGLITAAATLQEARPDARTYVIFISDGAPANYYQWNGRTYGTGNDGSAAFAQPQTVIAAQKFPWVNGFYTVYINNGDDSDPLNNMRSLLDAIHEPRAASGNEETRVGGPYFATDSTELTETFDKLVEEMYIQRFTDVELSDTLSNWVEPVTDDDGNITPTLTIYQKQKDAQGEYITDPETGEAVLQKVEPKGENDPDDVYKEVSVSYEPATKTIKFNTVEERKDTAGTTAGTYYDPAHLRDDYVYEVTLHVKLTEDLDDRKTAEGFFNDCGRYPEMDNPYAEDDGSPDGPETKGQEGTGTHAGEAGFYSNKEATLDYSVFSDPQERMEFPKPVVQLPYVELTITKTVKGAMGSYGDDFDFTLTLRKDLLDDHGDPIIEHWDKPLTIVQPDEEHGITGTTAEGYENETQLAVNGTQPSDPGTGGTDPGAGGGTADAPNAYTYEFTLSHGEQIALVVPYGYDATVTEEDVSSRGYEVKARITHYFDDGTPPSTTEKKGNTQTYEGVNVETTFEFVNTRQAVAPTGLEGDHTAPYVLMVSASALAGMALLGGMAARRARRRREW